MRRIELTLMTLVVASTLVWLFKIPYAGSLMLISVMLQALFYLGFGLFLFNKIKFKRIFNKDSYKEISGLRKIGSIVTGLSFSFICIGSLFKLYAYSVNDIILIDGLVLLIIITIISIVKSFRCSTDFYKQILIRTGIIGGSGLLIFIMPI